MAYDLALRLQNSAIQFRELALTGDDALLKAALLQLADEFEREAAKEAPGHPVASST